MMLKKFMQWLFDTYPTKPAPRRKVTPNMRKQMNKGR